MPYNFTRITLLKFLVLARFPKLFQTIFIEFSVFEKSNFHIDFNLSHLLRYYNYNY